MMNVQALIQVKAFARQDGVFLALLWIASFAATLYMPGSGWGNIMAISTPFFVGWLLIRFRNYALDGAISFRRGLLYSCYTFFYAALIFAVAQYLYFRYLDHGLMVQMLVTALKQAAPIYEANGMSLKQMEEALGMFGQLPPIQLSFLFMMQNILTGIVLSLPIALFCRRNRQQHANN